MRRTSSLTYFCTLCCSGEVYAMSFGSKCIAFRSISCCYYSVTLLLALCSCKLWFVSRIYPSSSSSSGCTITSCISSHDSPSYSLCASASRTGDGSTVLGYGRVVISQLLSFFMLELSGCKVWPLSFSIMLSSFPFYCIIPSSPDCDEKFRS